MCLSIFYRVPFSLLPLNELIMLLMGGRSEHFCTPHTPCLLLNRLCNSATHSVSYYYPYFCRWGNWNAELWSNLFKIILLLSGRSEVLTWVWLIYWVTTWLFSQLCHEVKKKNSDFFLLNVFVITLNHVIIDFKKLRAQEC